MMAGALPDGANISMTTAALFIARATGVHLSLGDQITLLAVAMISSKGAAGVTGAGFITLAATLSIVPSVPTEGMALVLGVDSFMSECRSVANFMGNAVATVVIARWEGSLDDVALDKALSAPPRWYRRTAPRKWCGLIVAEGVGGTVKLTAPLFVTGQTLHV
jgi:aerobic C4-dicarboxylate transport protein